MPDRNRVGVCIAPLVQNLTLVLIHLLCFMQRFRISIRLITHFTKLRVRRYATWLNMLGSFGPLTEADHFLFNLHRALESWSLNQIGLTECIGADTNVGDKDVVNWTYSQVSRVHKTLRPSTSVLEVVSLDMQNSMADQGAKIFRNIRNTFGSR